MAILWLWLWGGYCWGDDRTVQAVEKYYLMYRLQEAVNSCNIRSEEGPQTLRSPIYTFYLTERAYHL